MIFVISKTTQVINLLTNKPSRIELRAAAITLLSLLALLNYFIYASKCLRKFQGDLMLITKYDWYFNLLST